MNTDKCWEWPGRIGPAGYGVVHLRGTDKRAHRMMWEMTVGPIPPDKEVCHTCDNRACCNPTHLYIGTHLENMQDMVDRDRVALELRNGRCRLASRDIAQIRVRAAAGERHSAIAEDYGTTRGYVWQIVNGTRRTKLPPAELIEPIAG